MTADGGPSYSYVRLPGDTLSCPQIGTTSMHFQVPVGGLSNSDVCLSLKKGVYDVTATGHFNLDNGYVVNATSLYEQASDNVNDGYSVAPASYGYGLLAQSLGAFGTNGIGYSSLPFVEDASQLPAPDAGDGPISFQLKVTSNTVQRVFSAPAFAGGISLDISKATG